jgi:hypothetical protein
MKWIKTFESYRKTKDESVNEEFLGKLLQGIKNKLSVGFSKMFGNASKADKVMEEYKKELVGAQFKKREALKAFGLYFKTVKDGGEVEADKIGELKKNLTTAEKNYDEQVKLIKQKFDIKFKEVVDEEKNKKILNYIQLKKIEMQQELLAEETKAMLADGGLNPDEIEDEDFKNMLNGINKKMEDAKKMQSEQKAELEKKEEKLLDFDLNKAKQMAEKGETYLWEESPMKDYQFDKGDKIEFFSKSNKESTKATVEEDLGERIKVKTEKGSEVEINKKTVISSENFAKSSSAPKPPPPPSAGQSATI